MISFAQYYKLVKQIPVEKWILKDYKKVKHYLEHNPNVNNINQAKECLAKYETLFKEVLDNDFIEKFQQTNLSSKKKVRKWKLLFGDIEVVDRCKEFSGDLWVLNGAIVDTQGNRCVLWRDGLDGFIDFLKSQKENLLIMFHNLKYDAGVLLKQFSKYYKLNIETTGQWSRKDFSAKIDIRSSKTSKFELYIVNKWKKPIYVQFSCSKRIINSPVERLYAALSDENKKKVLPKHKMLNGGKPMTFDISEEYYTVGMQRAYFEWKNNGNEKLMEELDIYVENDARLVSIAMGQFSDTIWNIQEQQGWEEAGHLRDSDSISGFMFKLINTYLKKEYGQESEIVKNLYLDRADWKRWNHIDRYGDLKTPLFLGGFTQARQNWLGKKYEGDIYSFDINSSYPNVMSKPLPIGKPELITPEPIVGLNLTKELTQKYIPDETKTYIFEVKMSWEADDGNFPTIRDVREDGYISSSYLDATAPGEFRNMMFFAEEFAMQQKFNFIRVVEYKVYELKLFPFLKKLIDILYPLKENAEDETIKQAAKLLLNSGYGKFAQKAVWDFDRIYHNEKDKETIKMFSELVDKDERYYGAKVKFRQNPWENHTQIGFVIDNFVSANNILIGAYITSQARCSLFRFYDEINIENVLYSDTDSVKFDNREANLVKYEEYPFEDGTIKYSLKEAREYHNQTKVKPIFKKAKVELNVNIDVGEKLGQWGYEFSAECLIIPRRKSNIAETMQGDKATVGGINKDWAQENIELLKEIFLTGKGQVKVKKSIETVNGTVLKTKNADVKIVK